MNKMYMIRGLFLLALIGCACTDALASNSGDIKTLVTEERWDLGGGYALEAMDVDLEGDKVWLWLYKDGSSLDSEVIDTGSSDLQDRVYTYTDAGDVLIFSCYVSAVFRGTCSSMAQVEDVYLIGDQFSGDYGFALDDCRIGSEWALSDDYSIAAKDVAIAGDKARIILLKDGVVVDERILTEESIAPVDSDSHYVYVKDGIEIVNATLKMAFQGSESNAVELVEVYQCSEIGGNILIHNESHLFKSVNPTGVSWDLADGYALTMKDTGIDSEVWLELSKNDVVVKETILTESSVLTYCSGDDIINGVVDRVFYGCEANAAKLVNINQYSGETVLLADESHFYKSADPTGMRWELLNGYALTMKDIDIYSDNVWLELSEDGSVLKDDVLELDDFFVYETGVEIVNCTVDVVFHGTFGDMVKLADVNQYTETGRQLIDHGSKTFATTNPIGDGMWELYENYSLDAKDVDLDGDKAWLSLSKDGVVVEDAIVDDKEDGWFEYYNAEGSLVFSAYTDTVFGGTDSNIVQLKYVSQYSETDGSVLIMFGEYDIKTLYAGAATTILPSIATPIDGQIFIEGDVITFNASASDGTAPYTYTWYEDGSIIGTGNSLDSSFATGSHTIALIITDAAATSVSDRVRVEIKSSCGDIDQDGAITSIDALIASNMAVRGEWNSAADVSGDGNVTSLDTLMILQAAAGNIDL